ncbi:hypothetical protein BSN85_08825 [Bradyrhizobium brasilense]|nr:hypothetical protein BSN85_08825 [Bradyrhizobium brasilense]
MGADCEMPGYRGKAEFSLHGAVYDAECAGQAARMEPDRAIADPEAGRFLDQFCLDKATN